MSAISVNSMEPRGRITVDQFERMIAANVFEPESRLELIRGEIITMSPIGPSHVSVVDDLNEYLSRLRAEVRVSVQAPMRLDEFSRPQPDLMLLKKRDDRYRFALPVPAEILLVIEVSDTTFAYDYNVKRSDNAAQGIREMWIVDISKRRILVFRDPKDGAYQSETVATGTDEVAPELFAHHRLVVRDLLG